MLFVCQATSSLFFLLTAPAVTKHNVSLHPYSLVDNYKAKGKVKY